MRVCKEVVKACCDMGIQEGPGTHQYQRVYDPPATRWCFRGRHTVSMKDDDHRRKETDTICIEAPEEAADLQHMIDTVPKSVRFLMIKPPAGNCCAQESGIRFEVNLPSLEWLQLHDVVMKKIRLNEKLTPKLVGLSLSNVPKECDVDIKLPNLADVAIFYHDVGDDNWVQRMLTEATKLRTLNSYKLRTRKKLKLASNELTSVRLHRAEATEILEMWAPKLVKLDLQAAYGVTDVNLLTTHRLAEDLPPGHELSKFYLNVENCTFSARQLEEFESHPRVRSVYRGNAESANSMEGHFAKMHHIM
eukprot:GHVU01179452.1.p1 GENE.GHVU01179452.1~~GHVU01179452.1.p1  ORF type:complete len:305 (-),score=45.56 GHVU01179452.1:274-1188(-)